MEEHEGEVSDSFGGQDHEAGRIGVVLILDDDRPVLRGLERLLTGEGYRVIPFDNPQAFLAARLPDVPKCLLLDIQLGDGMTGLGVHEENLNRGVEIPTVFLTAYWDVQKVVAAMRAGADGFLTKPYDPKELLNEVELALRRAKSKLKNGQVAAEARSRMVTLTPREQEIVRLVLAGLLNKEIADRLGLALVTVKVHRGRAMKKLAAGNPAELAHIARLAGLEPAC